MQVILTKDLETLGDSGEIVNVSDGYARNYLFPQKLAVEATKGALKDLASRGERLKAKAEKKHQLDLSNAEEIKALGIITLEANAGDDGKLFGTITTKELANVLRNKTGLDIDRKTISIDRPINRVGDYNLSVKFSPKVSVTIGVSVVSASIANDLPPATSFDHNDNEDQVEE